MNLSTVPIDIGAGAAAVPRTDQKKTCLRCNHAGWIMAARTAVEMDLEPDYHRIATKTVRLAQDSD